jgi:hypothetical protein
MNRVDRFRGFAIVSLAALCSGCAGIQIIPEPFVLPQPGTGRFQVHAQVANFDPTQSPFIVWMKLHAEYWPVPKPQPGQAPCVLDRVDSLGFIPAGGSFKLGPEDVLGHQPENLSLCPCVQLQCTGSIDLVLLGGNTPQTRVQLNGRHTAYNFTWVPSGDPNDPHELIRDFSIVPQGH